MINLEQSILEPFLTEGLFASLFYYLLFYVLKGNNRRENNYENLIKELIEVISTDEKAIEIIKNYKNIATWKMSTLNIS